MQEIIFFGNGPLATHTLEVIQPHFHIIFHAKTRADLATVPSLKKSHPAALGILASFGVIIKPDLLELFEPTGILNLHPSLLPAYRGPSPIETAILNGDTDFGISIMKLVKAMDAGPIYYQTTLHFDLSTPKSTIYQELAHAGANWLIKHLASENTLATPTPQDDSRATYCQMLNTSMSPLDPTHHTATELSNQIRAFQGFPRSKLTLFDHDCTILSAQVIKNLPPQAQAVTLPPQAQAATPTLFGTKKTLYLSCKNHTYLEITQLQPAGKKPMPIAAFLNGYAK